MYHRVLVSLYLWHLFGHLVLGCQQGGLNLLVLPVVIALSCRFLLHQKYYFLTFNALGFAVSVHPRYGNKFFRNLSVVTVVKFSLTRLVAVKSKRCLSIHCGPKCIQSLSLYYGELFKRGTTFKFR